jgi:hypothetical protein
MSYYAWNTLIKRVELLMAEIQAAAGTPFARETGFAHFDGIFLIGIGAARIASLSQSWSRR